MLIACNGDSVDVYFGSTGEGDAERTTADTYTAAFYWSMMTMTTVGYGDISMRTQGERLFSILAMIIGGGFYGYVIGYVTSVVADRGYRQRTFKERMEVVMAWLRAHPELPRVLRKRIWLHFKDFLTSKHVVDDSLILNDLSPSLGEDVNLFLLDDDVRHNPIFEGLPAHALSRLNCVLVETMFVENEYIVSQELEWQAMYIIKSGTAELTQSDGCFRELNGGESFGEETLFDVNRRYAYSVTAKTPVRALMIERAKFMHEFADCQELVMHMMKQLNDPRSFDEDSIQKRSVVEAGRASLLRGGREGVPPPFADAVLDACLIEDPKSKVACETATKDNMVMVAGEITTQAKIDYEKTVRGVVAKIGFDSYVDDLSSVDSKGLSDKTCEVLVRINKQSPDIAGGVHVGKDDLDVGAGDQGIMFGYASDETADCMPLTHSMATRLGKKLTDVRKNGDLWWLRPDGKTQVTIQYLQKADGSVQPLKIHTVVISTQHAEPGKAVRTKECDGYSGEEMTAPSMEEMNKLIEQKVIRATLREIKLKNGKPALSLYGKHTHLHINPTGKFIIGGPQGDAGLTGRKIIIDTYGGWGAHGGGAFSGKDPTKVDRSAAYICRQMAKSVVKSRLAKRCLVQLSYAIGVAKPLSLFVETYGTHSPKHSPDDITKVLKIAFDARPGAIAVSLALREPKYQETAAYCHFGREPVTKDGMKFFEWENPKDLSKYKNMSADQIGADLKGSNYLTKWVD